ncbi:hypothetical protein MRX96_003076 [Rhipicephalus microplus]
MAADVVTPAFLPKLLNIKKLSGVSRHCQGACGSSQQRWLSPWRGQRPNGLGDRVDHGTRVDCSGPVCKQGWKDGAVVVNQQPTTGLVHSLRSAVAGVPRQAAFATVPAVRAIRACIRGMPAHWRLLQKRPSTSGPPLPAIPAVSTAQGGILLTRRPVLAGGRSGD